MFSFNTLGKKFDLPGSVVVAGGVEAIIYPQGWDIANATDTGRSLDINLQQTAVMCCDYSNDGHVVMIAGLTPDAIHELTCPNAFSLLGASYSGNSFDTASLVPTQASVRGISLSPDGTSLTITGSTPDLATVYTLGTPNSLGGTVTVLNSYVLSGTPSGCDWNLDGFILTWLDGSFDTLHEIDCPTAYSLDSATDGGALIVSGLGSTTHGFQYGDDDTRIFVSEYTNKIIAPYMITGGNISTGVHGTNLITSGDGIDNPYGMCLSPTGHKMLVADPVLNKLLEYDVPAF